MESTSSEEARKRKYPPVALEIEPLSPGYDPEPHEVYVNLLKEKIEDTHARLIALTGSYGVGKSSILKKVVDSNEGKTIEISLSTLGDEHLGSEVSEVSEDEGEDAQRPESSTNRIQKEIVKQLLYIERPQKMRRSRFNRIARASRWRESVGAAIFSAILVVASTLLGITQSVADRASQILPNVPKWSIVLLLMLFAGCAWLYVRYVSRGNIFIEKLTAGTTTLTLSSKKGTYFDDYLDEIVYFFEVSKRTLVIIEDIDRFGDSGIFEELRALNVLLNRAGQLGGRKITFLFAVKDSIFESSTSNVEASDKAELELQRANRTKFFDVVIPVIPFISRNNARDHFKRKLGSPLFDELPQALITLAAPHVADMRLIINICNEYRIYRDKLLVTKKRLPELTPAKLFAMIVYKNVHMADFERISLGTSSLDDLYYAWRATTDTLIDQLSEERASLQTSLQSSRGQEMVAAELGGQLERVVAALASGNVKYKILEERAKVVINGVLYESDAIRTEQFWLDLVENRSLITIRLDQPNGQVLFEIHYAHLATLLGSEPEFDRAVKKANAVVEQRIAMINDEIQFLHYHSWSDAWNRGNSWENHSAASSTSFAELCTSLMKSKLAIDLISNDHIDQYFALYCASFEDEYTSMNTIQYIQRCIDRGRAEANFLLTSSEVEEIISERGIEILSESSMLNINVFDHLFPGKRASKLLQQISRIDERSLTFIGAYLETGKQATALVAQISQHWPTVHHYLVDSVVLDLASKVKVLDVALINWNPEIHSAPRVNERDFLSVNYHRLGSLSEDELSAYASTTIGYLYEAGVVVEDLSGLTVSAQEAALEFGNFKVNLRNLEALTRSSVIDLDSILFSEQLFEHLKNDLPGYIEAFNESEATTYTVLGSQTFTEVVKSLEGAEEAQFIFKNASPECQVTSLEDIELSIPSTLQALALTHRFPASISNILTYIETVGQIDEPLARLLVQARTIVDPGSASEESRRSLALGILGAPESLLEERLRIRLAKSLKPFELLSLQELPLKHSPSIASLLKARVILDDASSFEESFFPDWKSREQAIIVSRNFEGFVSPEVLPSESVGKFFSSTRISAQVRGRVLEQLPDYISSSSRDVRLSVARSIRAHDGALSYEQISSIVGGRGLFGPSIIKLISRSLSALSIENVHDLLSRMQDPYRFLAYPSGARPKFPNDEPHRTVLRYLEKEGFIRTLTVGRGGKFQANMRQK